MFLLIDATVSQKCACVRPGHVQRPAQHHAHRPTCTFNNTANALIDVIKSGPCPLPIDLSRNIKQVSNTINNKDIKHSPPPSTHPVAIESAPCSVDDSTKTYLSVPQTPNRLHFIVDEIGLLHPSHRILFTGRRHVHKNECGRRKRHPRQIFFMWIR